MRQIKFFIDRTPIGKKPLKIKGYLLHKKLYGFSWVVHRSRWWDEKKTELWYVSEFSTGLLAANWQVSGKTRQEAVSKSINFLIKQGRAAVKQAVSKHPVINKPLSKT